MSASICSFRARGPRTAARFIAAALAAAALLAALCLAGCGPKDEAAPSPPSGSLVEDFGNGGVVTWNPTGLNDAATAKIVVGSWMYVAGTDQISSGDAQWRIEKRYK